MHFIVQEGLRGSEQLPVKLIEYVRRLGMHALVCLRPHDVKAMGLELWPRTRETLGLGMGK